MRRGDQLAGLSIGADEEVGAVVERKSRADHAPCPTAQCGAGFVQHDPMAESRKRNRGGAAGPTAADDDGRIAGGPVGGQAR